MIPLLWRAQEQDDYWLPKPAIEYVGRMLDMPYIRVLEVATFYTMFNLEPVGGITSSFAARRHAGCAAPRTSSRSARAASASRAIVTPDGKFSWLEVECLGACCNAPMVQINNDYYEDLTPESFNKLLDDLAAGRPVKRGRRAPAHLGA